MRNETLGIRLCMVLFTLGKGDTGQPESRVLEGATIHSDKRSCSGIFPETPKNMHEQLSRLIEIYKEVNETGLISPLDWVDFGSSGYPDSYILPLSQLRGRCLCVEGRSGKDSSTTFRLMNGECKTVMAECFVTGTSEYRLFHESEEGGGSTFYPASDIFYALLQESKAHQISQYIVNTYAANELLKQNGIEPLYVKLDIEGAEQEVLESIFEDTEIENPYVVECEINIGSRGIASNGRIASNAGEVICKMSEQGYRLIDIRKTYLLPDSKDMLEQVSKEPVFSPAYQGILQQFDGLFLKEQIVTQCKMCKPYRIAQTCLILCLYRQFHLAMNITEKSKELIGEEVYSLLKLKVIPSVYSEFKKCSDINMASIWGYHPLFNWLKST